MIEALVQTLIYITFIFNLVIVSFHPDCSLLSLLECGMWNVECGRWNVECGMWKVEGGRWKVEGGRWKVEGGRWKVEFGAA